MFSKKIILALLFGICLIGIVDFVSALERVSPISITVSPDGSRIEGVVSNMNDSDFSTYYHHCLVPGPAWHDLNITFPKIPVNATNVTFVAHMNSSNITDSDEIYFDDGGKLTRGNGVIQGAGGNGQSIPFNVPFNHTWGTYSYGSFLENNSNPNFYTNLMFTSDMDGGYVGFFEFSLFYDVDNIAPQVETNFTTGTYYMPFESDGSYQRSFGVNVTENYLLALCQYSRNGGAWASLGSCTIDGSYQTKSINGFNLGANTIQFNVTDGAGHTANTSTIPFTLRGTGLVENSQSYETTSFEGASRNFGINVSYDSAYYTSASANLIYNGTSYPGVKTGSGTNFVYNTSITVPNVDSQQNYTFYWQFSLYNGTGTTIINSASHNQTVNNLVVDDCSSGTVLVYNFTLNDENTRNPINGTALNSSMQFDLSVKSTSTGNEILSFSNYYEGENPAQICLAQNLSDETYRVDLTGSYVADGYVKEFYYIDNGTLSDANIPNNINLYDLPLDDSTTFLFTFLDENGLTVPGVIIETLRYFIGEGEFIEVERSKEDNNGETHIHLIEEDAIYKFMVTLENEEIFLSDQYNAKCLSNPCSITLSAEPENEPFPEVYDNLPEGSFSLQTNKSNRQVTLFFNLNETATMNLSIWTMNNNEAEITASGVLTASSGSLTVTVPLSYGNSTYSAVIYKDGEFVASRVIDLSEDASDYFGALGLFLGALAILSLALIGASHGEWVIVWTVLGLITTSALYLVDLPWYALLIFIAGAGVFMIKLVSRRRVG